MSAPMKDAAGMASKYRGCVRRTSPWAGLLIAAAALLWSAVAVAAGATSYRQVTYGIAVYFGIMPAQLVRGHPPGHAESKMHGGPPPGENHLVVALFNDKTGERIGEAQIAATITGPGRFKSEKNLEPMMIAGAATFGNYFRMSDPGSYRIALRIRAPGVGHDIHAAFTWTSF